MRPPSAAASPSGSEDFVEVGEGQQAGEGLSDVEEQRGSLEVESSHERNWTSNVQKLEVMKERLVGLWRISLSRFARAHIAEQRGPGLAIFATSLADGLVGESYSLVTVRGDGTGSASTAWMGEIYEGTGQWEVVAVDGDYAQIRVVVPAEQINRIFSVRVEEDRIHAQYNGIPAVFYRQ